MLQDLGSHIQNLVVPSDQDASDSDKKAWNDLLDRWEAEAASESAEFSDDDEQTPHEPLPTLLDFYKPGPQALAFPRLDDEEHEHRIAENHTQDGEPRALPVVNAEPTPSPSAAEHALAQKVKSLVREPSILKSLQELLASSDDADELQFEVLQILGMQGEAFDITAQILNPERRPLIAELLKPSSHNSRNRRAVARGLNGDGTLALPTSQAEADAMIEAQLAAAQNRPLWTGERRAVHEEEQYPNVYKSGNASSALSYGGRMALPLGTITQETDISSEVIIPPANPIPLKLKERLIAISELDPLAAGCFPGYTTLNRIQSIVQPIAMNTNENMLVCAPTGAGKTDVAIMSILRVLSQNVKDGVTRFDRNSINKDHFKIIYVAPMKALAAEITRKFAKRLAWLGIVVKELTGDMQLTKQEIQATQVIVTTPEKWDVVTRKPTGEGELASLVKLLIIDEVHLLNEERGAVIETIVARTLRQVESSQSLIRIVGLSATLPNYIDVSDFLKVNRYQGLFFFDAAFRPVPLEQHFIGVRGKVRSEQSKRNMDQAVFDKVTANLAEGHQVMVFVHARKETVKSGEKLKEMAQSEGLLDDFSPLEHPRYDAFRREIATSKNKEMKQLFDAGIGIHHAGMLRSDRNMMERMFEANCLKVLVCTATLAWGVNLPAHAVVIKGTQVYDSSRGSFVDLSILDVLQIFGRAGRPGYETSGVGYICTTADKLDHYLSAVLTQHPIESKLVPGMLDAMNAEISLGTIATVSEAVEWLGYTYLYVRMRRNPFLYGMEHDVLQDDPQLINKRNSLARIAGRRLAEANMIIFDEINNKFHITDLGRIAAKYYLKHETVEVFNKQFRSRLSEADTIALLSQSTEFNQLQVRDNELEELKTLAKDVIPCQVKGGTDTIPGKVNILLQAYICGAPIEDFALVSDTAYIAQNSGRIIRALLEIAMSRKWANASAVLAAMSKSIEKRLWPFQNPLRQSNLQREVIRNLEAYADELAPIELASKSAAEIAVLIRSNEKHGTAVLNAAKQFPTVDIRYALRPLSDDMLRMEVSLEKMFTWNANIHDGSEPFYVWIEDESGMTIYQSQHVLFRQMTKAIDLEFVVPILSKIPDSVTIRAISDRWVGSEDELTIDLANLVMPSRKAQYTSLLDLPLLSVTSAFGASLARDAYNRLFTSFNSIQTQAFWTLYHTDCNVLLSAPTASGKSSLVDIAAWRSVEKRRKGRILYLCHNASSASDTYARVKKDTLILSSLRIMRLQTAMDFSTHQTTSNCLGVCIPSTALESLVDYGDFFEDLSLVVFDDLHLLDPEYEMLILRVLECTRRADTRIVGCASSLYDGHDLAEWLRVPEDGRFLFRPTDRSTAMTTVVQPFSIPHSPTLMKLMVKPVYAAIKANLQEGAIVFVPSKAQCHSVAMDLITRSGMEMDLNGFLAQAGFEMEPFLSKLKTRTLVEPLLHGIGLWWESLPYSDSIFVLQLFAAGVLRALIVPRESCWNLKAQAGAVIVMGAQFVELHSSGPMGRIPDKKTRNYSLQELVKMQGFAARPRPENAATRNHVGGATGRFYLMCQAEQQEIYLKFLNEGLPLESSLVGTLMRKTQVSSIAALHDMLDDVSSWSEHMLGKPQQPTRQDFMDILSWSFLARRIRSNPVYYDATLGMENERLSRLVDDFLVTYFETKKIVEHTINDGTSNQVVEGTQAAQEMQHLD